MNPKQFLLTTFLTTALFLGAAYSARAQEQCEDVYGGGQVCHKGVVSIDKLVADPDNGIFVDNLGTDDIFAAGSRLTFRLRITNTGDFHIDTVTVKDTLPSYLEYVSGPSGDDVKNVSYDSGSRELRFDLKDLDQGETRDLDFVVQVVSEDNLPEGTACVLNRAEASANGRSEQDTAQVCVGKEGKQILGVTTLPETGPSAMTYLLFEALGFAVVGGLFLKLAKKRS